MKFEVYGDRLDLADELEDADGGVYESTIDANVWSPDAYPAGWTLIP